MVVVTICFAVSPAVSAAHHKTAGASRFAGWFSGWVDHDDEIGRNLAHMPETKRHVLNEKGGRAHLGLHGFLN